MTLSVVVNRKRLSKLCSRSRQSFGCHTVMLCDLLKRVTVNVVLLIQVPVIWLVEVPVTFPVEVPVMFRYL